MDVYRSDRSLPLIVLPGALSVNDKIGGATFLSYIN
jgi:hypothetical protein